MTFSIVALDAATGDLGVAVQSKFLAVGAVVPWARAGVGAVATQSFANVGYGPDGLGAAGRRVSADGGPRAGWLRPTTLRDERQAGIVDARGGAAHAHRTGCFAWAGGRLGDGFAAQGNILAGPAVVDGLADTFLAGGRPFPELLVACLAAADAAGGDRRGRESAALLVVRAGGGYGGGNDRWIDLRVDHHDDPIGELGRLARPAASLLRPPGDRADLEPVDEAFAAEIRSILESLGAGPGGRFGAVYAPMSGIVADDEAPPPVRRASRARSRPTGTSAGSARSTTGWPSRTWRSEPRRRAGSTGACSRSSGRGARRRRGERLPQSAVERLSRVVGPIATNVHVLADTRIARGDRDRHRDPVAWPGSPTSSPRATGRSS